MGRSKNSAASILSKSPASNLPFISSALHHHHQSSSIRKTRKRFRRSERDQIKMAALQNPFVSIRNSQSLFLSGSSLKPVQHSSVNITPNNHTSSPTYKRRLTVRAGGDSGRPSSASIFVGGFVLGGVIVGTLGCVFAPQISKALADTDKKDLMRKLPKFIYDEEKALEKTRKILTEKIEQLNSAIDDVSAQLRNDDEDDDDAPNGAAVKPDGLEASI